MRLMSVFFRSYPWQTLLTMAALLFAGVAEGIGLSALLPLLNLALRNDPRMDNVELAAGQANGLEQAVTSVLASMGLQPAIGLLLLIIVLGITIKSVLVLLARKQVGYTAASIATDLRLDMLRTILRSRWEYFLHQPVGKLTNALATEAQRSADTFVNGAAVLAFLIQTIIYGLVAVAVSWQATLVSLVAGILIIGVSHTLVRMAHRAGTRQTRLMTSLLTRLTDTLQSVKPLKAMAREHLTDRVLAIETSQLNKALRRQVFSSALLGVAQEQMFTIVIAAGMFVALVPFAMPLTTVMVLVVVLGRMLAQFGKAQRQYQRVAIGESAFWSLTRAIDDASNAEETLSAGTRPTLNHGIELRAVRFAYNDREVLHMVSLEIPAGSLTTLIGPSGAGKTTIVDLVIGLLKPQSGSICIDNLPMQQLDIREWREVIGYVPQETLLLHDTILHNVTLGDPELTPTDAEEALRAAGAWEFVRALPKGIHNVVGERGASLSGGQRQRIVIARALIRRPQLLILDEATSALDPASAAAICHTMQQLRGSLTILAISHQQVLVDAADCVYRLENGGAVKIESGSRGGCDSGADGSQREHAAGRTRRITPQVWIPTYMLAEKS